MRLLNTKTFVLQEFFDSQAPRYAILSHTWRDDEVLFKDLEHGVTAARQKHGWQKIENTCKTALRDGLLWAWIDTCCIDKSSSAELSEAINSMFRWYKDADVCYSFLDNVPAGSTVTGQTLPLGNAKWFKRGWTLQELITPSELIFYVIDWSTYEWHSCGTKKDLRGLVSSITKTPAEYLVGKDLAEASIAQRMSWAAQRETTRNEDVAYCLLGILDVNMPLLYGERGKAFIRLQEQIGRRSQDQSLLAWGIHPGETGQRAVKAQLNFRGADAGLPANVLATHPSQFRYSGSVQPYRNTEALQKYEVTNSGVHLTTSIAGAQVTVMDPVLATTFDIHYAFLICYDHDVLNQLAIPVVRPQDGVHYHCCRVAPPAAYVLSLGDLASTSPLGPSVSWATDLSPYRRKGVFDRESFSIPQALSAGLESKEGQLIVNGLSDDSHDDSRLVFILRESNLELCEVYPPHIRKPARPSIISCLDDNPNIFTLLLKDHARQKLVLVSINCDIFRQKKADPECRTFHPVEYGVHIFPCLDKTVDMASHHETFCKRSEAATMRPDGAKFLNTLTSRGFFTVNTDSQVSLTWFREEILQGNLPDYECSFEIWAYEQVK